jgi:hypothetical protein
LTASHCTPATAHQSHSFSRGCTRPLVVIHCSFEVPAFILHSKNPLHPLQLTNRHAATALRPPQTYSPPPTPLHRPGRRFAAAPDAAAASYAIRKSHLPPLIHALLFATAHLLSYLLLLLYLDHAPGLVLLRHSGGPDLNHLIRLCHDRVPDLLLLCHGDHYRQGVQRRPRTARSTSACSS